MEIFSAFADNYRVTMKGINPYVKFFFTLVLAFILLTVISAVVNVIVNGA
ncbi:hypothetical protein RM549_03390 [Salegentibacter sp. F188]|uniref:Uncharacterized protein n=1 Tax=Autumnicola patrickiae TaxID=3075591 RepID=A0ABU3DYR1_9FLAO|nr:hypothetical protein [Salegentibacter sp. F188]MDT0688810.1 hypothetical protein [Salegentibacter sp. F188]